MSLHPPHQDRRPRQARWLLLVWLGLVLASVWSPWSNQPHAERLCSASGAVHWVASPVAEEDGSALPPALDCPLCLPAWAPAPTDWALAAPTGQPPRRPVGELGWVFPPSLHLPPVRAPPAAA